MGDAENKNFKVGCLLLLLVIVAISVVLSELSDSNNGETSSEQIGEFTAISLCKEAYRNAAKYDVDMDMFPANAVYKLDDRWVIKIEGKMQNGFGAWLKTFAHCEVPFDSEEVSKIEFTQK